MSNKPMLSVERELLESCWAALMKKGQVIKSLELRALLDKPAKDYVLINGMHFSHAEILEWREKACADMEKAAQPQGEPVAYWYVGDIGGYGCLYTSPDKDGIKIYAEQPAPVIRCSFCDVTDNAGNPWSGHHESVDGKLIYRVMGCKDHKHLVEALDGSKSTPVEDHTQCEECKGWGYHENHHEGGGTECGECDGSGNAPVAVVIPERMDPRDPYDSEANQWNACLDEVARLNGVKP